MKKWMLIVTLVMAGCSRGNRDFVQQRANRTWEQAGFHVVGYEGYQIAGGTPGTPYGGAFVWYVVRKEPDNGITYHGALQRWGDEVHIYSLQAIDAIRPRP